MGQYVTREGKKYYKADDGKLYSNFESAYASQNPTFVEKIFGIPPNAIRPLESQLSRFAGGVGSGIMSGLKQLDNLGRSAYAVVDPQGAQEAELENWLRTGSMGSSDTGRSSERQGPPVPLRIQNAPPAPALPPPSGGTTLIYGTRDGVTPDRTQSDEYRAQMAQYGALQKAKKFEEAEKLGMDIWQKKYGKTAMAQEGGAVGAINPLMASTFGYQKGERPIQTTANIVPGQDMPAPGFSTESSFNIAGQATPSAFNFGVGNPVTPTEAFNQGEVMDANRGVQNLQPLQRAKTNPMNSISQQAFNFVSQFQK